MSREELIQLCADVVLEYHKFQTYPFGETSKLCELISYVLDGNQDELREVVLKVQPKRFL